MIEEVLVVDELTTVDYCLSSATKLKISSPIFSWPILYFGLRSTPRRPRQKTTTVDIQEASVVSRKNETHESSKKHSEK